MSQRDRERPTGDRHPEPPPIPSPGETLGRTVRQVRDFGRDMSRALNDRDGDDGRRPLGGADPDALEAAARKHVREIRDFWVHAAIYAAVIGVLFIIDLLTGPGFWFYWPMLGWGIGVAIHGAVVLTEDVALDQTWEDRKVQERLRRLRRDAAGETRGPSASATTEMDDLVATGIERVAALRRSALGIDQAAARARALRICATADTILAALADEGREPRLARDFLDRYLAPASTIINQYARLSARGIASARPALERVEAHDLPLIERRMDELYERIHRGDVIDLQVASEMLELGLLEGGGALDSPSR